MFRYISRRELREEVRQLRKENIMLKKLIQQAIDLLEGKDV